MWTRLSTVAGKVMDSLPKREFKHKPRYFSTSAETLEIIREEQQASEAARKTGRELSKETRAAFRKERCKRRREDKRRWLAAKAAELVAADERGDIAEQARIRRCFFGGRNKARGNTQPDRCEGCGTRYERDEDNLDGWYRWQKQHWSAPPPRRRSNQWNRLSMSTTRPLSQRC
eukprot:SAG31_NODE_16939_length_689_cov_2.113559_1_plen_174_part_00